MLSTVEGRGMLLAPRRPEGVGPVDRGRQMDDFETIIQFVIFGAFALGQIIFRVLKERANTGSEDAEQSTLQGWLQNADSALADAVQMATGQLTQIAKLGAQLPARSEIIPVLSRLRAAVEDIVSTLKGASVEHESLGVREAFAALEQVPDQLVTLQAWAQQAKADADNTLRLAEDLLEPMWTFCRVHGVGVPSSGLLAIPSGPEHRRALESLLPDQPFVGVPQGLDSTPELAFWVARDVGRVLLGALPDLRAWADLHAPRVAPRLPSASSTGVNVDPKLLIRAWFPALLLDALVATQLGPAALAAMVALLARDDSPERVVSATAMASRLGPQPPADLRVRVMARILGQLGHIDGVAERLHDWVERHGHPKGLLIPMADGRRVRVAVDPFVDAAHAFIEDFYSDECQIAGGYPLSAVGGFDLSPSRWARERSELEAVTSGRGTSASPRMRASLLISAVASAPAERARIVAGQRRARPSDRAHSPAASHTVSDAERIRRAMVLRFVLERGGRDGPGARRL